MPVTSVGRTRVPVVGVHGSRGLTRPFSATPKFGASRPRRNRAMPDAPSPKSHAPNAETAPAAPALPSGGTWSGRFSEPMSERMRRFNASVDFDKRLAEADIEASTAHARMLAAAGIISADDLAAIERGLGTIKAEI